MPRTSPLSRSVRLSIATLAVGAVAVLGSAIPSAAAVNTAPAASHPSAATAATITPAQEFQRAAKWLTANNGSQVPYSQTQYWKDGYRQDCSGYVSMALGLGAPGTNTVGLATSRSLTTPITLAKLHPGDLLIDADGTSTTRHVVIFEKWTSSAHNSYMAYEQRGGHGTDHRTLDYGLASGSEFKPYHPVNVNN